MRPDLLLVINGALQDRLKAIINSQVIAEYVENVLDAFEEQNIFAATLVEPNFDVENLQQELRVFASSASLFGAEFATGVTAPPEVRTALVNQAENVGDAAAATLAQRVTNDARMNLFNVITDLDVRIRVGEAEFSRVQLTPQLVQDTERLTNRRIAMVSELQTTRLSAAGGLTLLDVQGITEYEWSAVLDNRSCPICEALDGTRFEVRPSLDRVQGALRAESDAEVAERNPWHPQDMASIERFQNLSPESIQAGGWAVPPAHPLCRCLVAPVGT